MDRSARQYWDHLALRWRFAAPLSPSATDVAWCERQVAQLGNGLQKLQVMLLGVTPALAAMRWPDAVTLVAADWSTPMLTRVWPKQNTPRSTSLLCADWRQLPLRAACCDAIVGDGCYTALANLADYRLLNREMHRVLKPDGAALLRCFCRPSHRLEVDTLFEQLFAGHIASLDLFRFLLAMAMYEDSRTEITRRAVWELWVRHVPDARGIQDRMGWSDDDVANMERIANMSHSFCFPTLHELAELARPLFELSAHDEPTYAWGELFPRIVLRSR
jgi:SAM-dependent methyltransferase